tara:strand:- start:189 stop:752 length:564 start_codon:yes stop_codon:yes gene_type:complete
MEMNQQPNSGGYDEDWRKFLVLGNNNKNSVTPSDGNPDYGPYSSSLDSLKSKYSLPSMNNSDFSSSMNSGATINPDLFAIRTGNATQDYDSTPKDKGGLFGKGWATSDNLAMFSSLMSGAGNAAKGWAALKGIKQTDRMIDQNINEYNTNLANATTLTNNAVREKNNFLKSQNMSVKQNYLPSTYNS